MATSKTLTPTNETISIPAMTDQPDASVFSNCIDKEADAINTLNSQLTTKAKGVYQSWGKTLTSNAFHIGILIVNHNAAYIVWFAGTTDIDIRSLRASDAAKAATGSITFGEDNVNGTGYTITRNNANITVEASANATIALIFI